MKPKFVICRQGAQDKVPDVDKVIRNTDLTNICKRLTGQTNYDIQWIEQRIKGKMFTLETDSCKYFITYTPRVIKSRNSYLQSVPTAFGLYLNESIQTSKRCEFCLYFTPCTGNNQTRYHQLVYRLLVSMGINFINSDEGLRGLKLKEYSSVQELISDRDSNRERNGGNRSSYITDEGLYYHVYGKTFGANQKETTMLCLALCRISEKPIRLFQISDNDSTNLSSQDIKAVNLYAQNYGKVSINILDDTYEFEDDNVEKPSTPKEESLRSPRFIFNLLEKTGGHKQCTLCNCQVESIIQGSHIYPISAIRKRTDIDFDEKLKLATDKENGIWLCENHHKLFDNGLLRFVNGKMQLMPKLNDRDKEFVKSISTSYEIKKEYYTHQMDVYFNQRDEYYRKEKYY